MIITRTPLRLSFLGGGTDYPDHFRSHGGQTLGVSIDKSSYVTVNHLAPFFDYAIKVAYSRMELVNSIAEIQHPAVRECLRFCGIEGGMEIAYSGDLPARTGLGSSSSFTVGLLHALHAFKGELVGREQLAGEAVHVEQTMIQERVGVQDQFTCAVGGLVHLRFSRDGGVHVTPVPVSADRRDELRSHLMLLYTGISRHAHEVLEQQINRVRRGKICSELASLADMVNKGLDILTGCEPIARFGELLHEAWVIKRELSSKISNPQIDQWYERACRAGAVGGKLLGAGGGGFLLLCVEPDRQAAVRSALPELRQVDFAFEEQGTTLVYYNPVSSRVAAKGAARGSSEAVTGDA